MPHFKIKFIESVLVPMVAGKNTFLYKSKWKIEFEWARKCDTDTAVEYGAL